MQKPMRLSGLKITQMCEYMVLLCYCCLLQALVPPNQLLLKIDVNEVDYVDLGQDVRSIWSNAGSDSSTKKSWSETEVNP